MAGARAQAVVDEGVLRQRLMNAGIQLGLTLTDEHLDRLLAYLALLRRWNRIHNLTALRHPDDMLSHHLADCLATLPSLRRHADGLGLVGLRLRVLDVGSGGGLPGVVLAIMQAELQVEWQVTCVDAVVKKASFIRQVGIELGLRNLLAVHSRVEALPNDEAFDLITSRAYASLADFVTLTQRLLAAQGVWVAMKGKPPADEIAKLPLAVEMFHVEPLQVPGLNAQRCLVWMRARPG